MSYARARQYARVEVRAHVQLAQLAERSFPVRNVSLGGALVTITRADRELLPLGAVIQVLIFDPIHPSFGTVTTRAEVLRHDGSCVAFKWVEVGPKLLYDLDQLIERIRRGSG